MNLLAKENVADVYPLSPIQEGMLFHSLLTPESSPYQEQIVHDLAGEVDPELFERAWNLLVERHAILRTVFAEGRNKPLQIVLRTRPVRLAVLDLTALDETAQHRALPAVWEQDARGPLSVRKGPLFRLLLVALARRRFKFVWTFNHLVLDGWSSSLLLTDLAGLYGALAEGRPVPAADFVPFRSYIAWLAGRDRDQARAYWKRQLAGFTAPTPLPSESRVAAPEPSRRRLLRHRGVLSAAVAAELKALAQRQRVTPSIVIQAAWTVLLARFSGVPEVVFGLTVAGRPAELAGAERMVGPLINTLPVRAPAGGDLPLADLLHGLQQQYLNTSHFDDLPLVEVQASSEITPPEKIFHSLLDIHIQPQVTCLAFSGFELSLASANEGSGGTSFSLAADVAWAQTVEVELFADRDLLERPALVRLVRSLEAVLASLAARPQSRLGELEVMPAAERWQMVGEWSGAQAAAPPFEDTVHELFVAQARRTPDGVAAEHGGEQVSYGEVAQRAGAVAAWLRARGIGGEERVGVFGARGVEMLAGLLGVYQSGGAFLPLDPGHPDARLAAVLADSGARLVLTESRLAGRVAELGGAVGRRLETLCWDAMAPAEGAWGDAAGPVPAAGPQALANVFYTSGSTGVPKGALVEHGGLLAHLWAKVTLLGIGAGSVVAQNASHCFDISIWQLLSPLVVGGRVVIYADEVAQEPETFLARIERDGVTVLETVPSLLEPMLSAVPEGVRLAALPLVMSNAETLPVSLCRRWLERFPEIPVINTYGATECSDDVTQGVLDPPGEEVERLDVGRPIAGMRVYLLDRDLRPVPLGWPGQVAFSGVGVGRGYLADAPRTARSFVPDPLSGEGGGRLYLTGDLGCFGPRGELQFLGRIDDQVKVRGHRIELGEVEAALLRLAGVRQAAVLVRPDAAGQNRLVGFVVGDVGLTADASAVREGLRSVLPESMIPEQYVFLPALPVTRNGKVDRRTLATLSAPDLGAEGARHVEPRPGLEQTIAGVWRDVLQVERIGAHDNFFDLGGHSLRTIRVRSRLQQELAVEVPLRTLFDQPTVAGLAAALRPLLPETAAPGALAAAADQRIPRLPEAASYPLSHAQRRLWLRHCVAPRSPAYNLTGVYEIEEELEPTILAAALDGLVRRHEVLRTGYHLHDGEPVQTILPAGGFSLQVEDLRAADGREPEPQRLAQALCCDVLTPYDLAVPPVRARLIRCGERRHLLQLSLHHIAADLWSWQILEHDLEALYRLLAAGRPATDALRPLGLRYVDYAGWHAGRLQGERLERLERFWLDRFGGELPVLALPIDRTPAPDRTFEAHEVQARFHPETAARLRVLQREAGTTLLVAVLALAKAWLHRLTGQTDLVVGTPVAGRTQVDLEDLVGFFVNTLPLRSDLGGSPTVLELVRRVDQTALDAFAHEDYPFDLLVERLNPQREASGRMPVFSVLFALREGAGPTAAAGLLTPYAVGPADLASRRASDFDVEITFVAREGEISCLLSCSAEIFDRATVLRSARQLEQLVASAVRDAGSRLADLDLMSPDELHQVLREVNDTALALPASRCLHQLVERQAAATPDRIALASQQGCLTYAALDAWANGLAHRLVGLQVGPGTMVGICAERSLEMLVGLLAVLKAGAAFVPLDPDHPPSRLTQLLADSHMPVLLLQPHLAGKLPELPARVVDLEPRGLAGAACPTGPVPGVGADDLAYVLYTSGSTGQPKGAQNRHRSLVNCVVWLQQAFALAADDRVLQKTPLSFDVAMGEIFWPLAFGARLALAAPGLHRDPVALAQTAAREQVTTLHFVPSMLQVYLEVPGALSASLRRVICNGEALSWELKERFYRLGAAARLHNVYGPTEAAVQVAWWPCEPGGERPSLPIGRPIANTEIHLVGGGLRPAPVGVAGELLIGGTSLARGYLGRPDLTADRFVPDPFSGRPGDRLYRTGDLARRRADGAIEFLGRLDHQVKIRGHRIELGEVEAALGRHPDIRAAAVVVHRAPDGSPQLVAYVVADHPLAAAGLRELLARELPAAAVPEQVVQLDAFPTLPNGKLDRRALPRPALDEGDPLLAGPRDELERAMVEIWQGVLGIGDIGIHSNFFRLGGQSLRAISLLVRVADRLGAELPIDALFRHPTVAGLCGLVRDGRGVRRPAQGSLVPLRTAVSSRSPLFLVHPHAGEVFVYQALAEALGDDQPVYGLRSRGLDGEDETGDEPLTSIDAMAQSYLEEIRRVRPGGPYCLAGWSYGGIVAFEMARRLEAAGERVELLALLDVGVRQPEEEVHDAELDLGRLARLFFALDEGLFHGVGQDAAPELILRLCPQHPLAVHAGTPVRLRRLLAVLRANTLALTRHHLSGPVRADLHLFRASTASHVADPDAWEPWTLGKVRTSTVPGDHHQLLAPATVAVLAPLLRELLARGVRAEGLAPCGDRGA